MSKENNLSISGPDLPEIDSDPLDELILKMFLRKDLASFADIGDIDAEQMDDLDLNQEELQALVSLASSEEQIEEIASAADMTLAADSQQELSTLRDGAETVAEAGELDGDEASGDFRVAIHNVDKSEKQRGVKFRGEYRKTAELGRGGQGVVYRIEGEDDFSAAFALKVFSPQAYENLPDFSADMMRMQRIASLIHHAPHDDLVDIGWFGKCDGAYTMLMQYIDGFDLRRLLQPQLLPALKRTVGKKRWEDINNVVYSVNGSGQLALQPAIAVYIIERVLRGLGALHSRDIVHGDVKPSNIMLNASASVKIIDIGSAFEVGSAPTKHHFTPAYVAPEFHKFTKMSKQSDLASVGYMLIELLSGKPITDAVADPDKSCRSIGAEKTRKLLKAKQSLPKRLSKILPKNVLESDHLVELCRHLIDPDLEQRFPTAAESIVDSKGTYEFSKDLVLADLGVCNFHEVSQWLANVKEAMRWVQENTSMLR